MIILKNILRSETERMFKRKKTWIGIGVYLLLIGFQCLFLSAFGGVAFYSPEEEVTLNALNTAPFLLRELGLFFLFILIPMLVVDSFNGEYTSGAYRMVLLRPVPRGKLFLAKITILSIIVFLLLMITMAAGIIYGQLAFPSVTETTFLDTEMLQPLAVYGYVFLYYLTAFVILVSAMMVGSLISTILPNMILAYIGIIGFLVGSIYISDYMVFFLSMADTIFVLLAGQKQMMFSVILFLILGSYILNIGIWKKRDWIG
nr:ABC transporter permease [Oceanobacillus timonensis]